MEIAAIHPVQQFYVNGVLAEEPPYQPPRWRCDGCGREQAVPDYEYRPHYKDEAERPAYPEGWIRCAVVPPGPQYISERQWHFCTVACLAGYRGWLDADDADHRD